VSSHDRDALKVQPSRVVVADAVRAIARESRRRMEERGIRIEIAGGDEAVLADRDVLGRVLDNLIANALRHCPRGGLLRVQWRTDRDRVRVSVGNTGKPIPAEARARMFDEHWSASGSTGLGLYFCRVAIAAHGGSVVLEDGSDLPTIFTFDLPTAA
jgi:signal transduction histidine kinase